MSIFIAIVFVIGIAVVAAIEAFGLAVGFYVGHLLYGYFAGKVSLSMATFVVIYKLTFVAKSVILAYGKFGTKLKESLEKDLL